jgi:outer membrane protein TolC
LDLASAKYELATQQAKLREPDAAIFAAQHRLAMLLARIRQDITEAMKRPAKMLGLPEHLRPRTTVDLWRRRRDIRAERDVRAATALVGPPADLIPFVEVG